MNHLIATYKNKLRPPFYQVWISWYIGAILDVFCGLIDIATFCFYRPKLDRLWRQWVAKKFAVVIFEKAVVMGQEYAKKQTEKIQKIEEQALAALDEGVIKKSPINNVFS